MADTFRIERRYNGPRTSGNGGYSSGLFASAIGGPAAVSLRRPVPLDRDLRVEPDGDGGGVRILDGEALIAEVRPAEPLTLDVPAAPDPDAARAAMAHYRGPTEGIFCRCFVCGRLREDALGIFCGEVPGRDLVATTWTPAPWTADGNGAVRPEIVAAVLDCPTYFAVYLGADPGTGMLARFRTRLDAPVRAGEEHVVISWPLGVDGRKREGGVAVLGAGGEVKAIAHALLVEPRTQ